MNEILGKSIDSHLEELAKSKPIEDHCTNCGGCCKPSVKVVRKGHRDVNVFAKGLTCKFMTFDNGKSNCSIYKSRFENAPWCADLKTMIIKGIAPNDCPYVNTLAGYRSSVDLDSGSYGQFLPLLKSAIGKGDLRPFSDQDLENFLGS
jgi:hypothetical protein